MPWAGGAARGNGAAEHLHRESRAAVHPFRLCMAGCADRSPLWAAPRRNPRLAPPCRPSAFRCHSHAQGHHACITRMLSHPFLRRLLDRGLYATSLFQNACPGSHLVGDCVQPLCTHVGPRGGESGGRALRPVQDCHGEPEDGWASLSPSSSLLFVVRLAV